MDVSNRQSYRLEMQMEDEVRTSEPTGRLCRLEREFVLMGKDFGSFLIVRVTIRNRDVLAGGLTRLETDLLLIGKDLGPFLILTDTIRN